MKADELKTITTEALDKLAALLDAGRSDQPTALFRALARFHNIWHNVCLIASQRPRPRAWRGFRRGGRWDAAFAKARRASPSSRRSSDVRGTTRWATRHAPLSGFRAVYVFDVTQTDGDPLPAPAEASGDPGATYERLTVAIGKRGIAIEDVDDLGRRTRDVSRRHDSAAERPVTGGSVHHTRPPVRARIAPPRGRPASLA